MEIFLTLKESGMYRLLYVKIKKEANGRFSSDYKNACYGRYPVIDSCGQL